MTNKGRHEAMRRHIMRTLNRERRAVFQQALEEHLRRQEVMKQLLPSPPSDQGEKPAGKAA